MQGKNDRNTVGPTLGLIVISEHVEVIFNAAAATQIALSLVSPPGLIG